MGRADTEFAWIKILYVKVTMQLFNIFVMLNSIAGYRSCAICRAHSNDRIAFSIWRDDHDPVNMVSEGQNSSIMLASYACMEEFNTRVVSHTCDNKKRKYGVAVK